MDYPLAITISVGCCSVVYVLIRYYSSKRAKLIEVSETWWTPGTENSVSNDIRPYEIVFSEELVKDLKHRLKHTRSLTPPLKDVAWNYGTNTDALRKLLDYWADDYNFQERQKFINQYSHFKTNIQGVGLNDSPAGLAAYLIEKFSTGTNYSYKSREDGGFLEKYTYDELIDNLMIYWASNSITTAMRIYAEMFIKENFLLGKLINSCV
ncbi:juvenile hormone epoxide hydrolase 2 [Lasius niger]|uniref:Juvenile hormone epoxide hydrolase 2 n=1 Tax=Lasius niger TaxID=67767 RepID=A0A0J7KMB5_LASNI|nr:juvenile hormone epoxide hydrolase 2 [Lasius niger]